MIYQLKTLDDKLLGYTEELFYIRKNPSTGVLIQSNKEDAQGIAYKGIPYNFLGEHWFKDAQSVIITEYDTAEYLTQIDEQNRILAEQLAETDMAAIYLYETSLRQEVRDAEQDDAIIHIYEMIKE